MGSFLVRNSGWKARSALIACATLLAACQEPAIFTIEPQPFLSLKMKTFDEPGRDFRNVQFVLWNHEVPSQHDVSQALTLSAELEGIEAKVDPIKGELDQILKEHGQSLLRLKSLQGIRAGVERVIRERTEKLLVSEQKYSDKLNELAEALAKDCKASPEDCPDADAIEKLRAETETLRNEAVKLRGDVAKLKKRISDATSEQTSLEAELELILQQQSDWTSELAVLERQASDVVARLNQVTEFPTKNPNVMIRGGAAVSLPRIQLKEWDLPNESIPAVNYDSEGESPNIIDISYTPRGGRLEFTACVAAVGGELASAYHFNIARVKYDQEGIHYAGKIRKNVRKQPKDQPPEEIDCSELGKRKDKETRYGNAKISDRFN